MQIAAADHLLVLPVPFRQVGGQLFVEHQAAHGILCWRQHFESLIVSAPVLPEAGVTQQRLREMAWVPAPDLVSNVQLVPLPWAYRLRDYLHHRKTVQATLTECIRQSRYLQFAIGGLHGDWAAMAAQIAQRLDRPYAVHMDRVEHEVIRLNSARAGVARRLRNLLVSPLMRRFHANIIRNASVSLCHGADCLAAYRHLNVHSHLVHNIHLEAGDVASHDDTCAKASRIADQRPDEVLSLIYSGRVVADKAPLEWLQALALLKASGTKFRATWLGEGDLRTHAIEQCRDLGLADCVTFTGFESDRTKVLAAIQQAHMFVFTHITPESPRCLVEALLMGTPIVGYESAYAHDLIREHGGGQLVPRHDVRSLAMAVATLGASRSQLADLTRRARRDVGQLDANSVFAHRSRLIKQYAGVRREPPAAPETPPPAIVTARFVQRPV